MWLLKTYATRYACKPGLGHPVLTTGQINDNPVQKWPLTVLKRSMMVKDTIPFMVHHACGLEPLQYNCFQAAVRLYNSLTPSKSSTARQTLQADIQLSWQCDDWWSSLPVCYEWSDFWETKLTFDLHKTYLQLDIQPTGHWEYCVHKVCLMDDIVQNAQPHEQESQPISYSTVLTACVYGADGKCIGMLTPLFI